MAFVWRKECSPSEAARFSLPQGRMELTTFLKKSDRELQYRMEFADKFPLEANFRNALRKFTAWRELTKSFSIKKTPRLTTDEEREQEEPNIIKAARSGGQQEKGSARCPRGEVQTKWESPADCLR